MRGEGTRGESTRGEGNHGMRKPGGEVMGVVEAWGTGVTWGAGACRVTWGAGACRSDMEGTDRATGCPRARARVRARARARART